MKVVLDACVLYPTVMREIILGVAKTGLFIPIWSDRILEEWARATRKLGPEQEVFARGEIAMLGLSWPGAICPADTDLEASLYLPDPDDRHVLATAISSAAPVIMTMNLKDFPTNLMAEHGVSTAHPDAYLRQVADQSPEAVRAVIENVHKEAERLSGQAMRPRALLKKARLPRLGKFID